MLPEQKFLQSQVDEIAKAIETKCNQIVKLNIQKDATKNPNVTLRFIAQYEQQNRFEPTKILDIPVLSYKECAVGTWLIVSPSNIVVGRHAIVTIIYIGSTDIRNQNGNKKKLLNVPRTLFCVTRLLLTILEAYVFVADTNK